MTDGPSGGCWLNALGIVCALGAGPAAVRAALLDRQAQELTICADLAARELPCGRVNALLPSLAGRPAVLRTRTNALLAVALQQIASQVLAAVARYGARRVGVVIGTSTSGIGEAVQAFMQLRARGALPASFSLGQQELGNAAAFVSAELGTCGPAYVISTACSSSARALASAARMLNDGRCDAVIAGGSDALSRFVVGGFSALESVSAQRCNPMSVHRCGINLGEGAALFLMTREPGPVELAGWGESSDAHHISAPDPTGAGACTAMRAALRRAGIDGQQLDYVNLHGTATPQNDVMEAAAVAAVLGSQVAASSTKPLTGHTLGAAGAIEAALCWLAMTDNPQGRLPPHWWDGAADPALAPLALAPPGALLGRPLRAALSNSFAFGGSNASLVLRVAPP